MPGQLSRSLKPFSMVSFIDLMAVIDSTAGEENVRYFESVKPDYPGPAFAEFAKDSQTVIIVSNGGIVDYLKEPANRDRFKGKTKIVILTGPEETLHEFHMDYFVFETFRYGNNRYQMKQALMRFLIGTNFNAPSFVPQSGTSVRESNTVM